MKRILITGGCGFIGSYFTELQVKTDMEVLVVDKLTYASDIDYLPEGAKLIKKDINDLTYEDIGEINYCINFAAESHVDNSIEDGSPFVKSNINGTFNLLELCRKMKDFRKFVQVSTDEVYGDMDDLRGIQYADESFKLRPSSYYSASKAAADLLVESASRTFGIPYIITRSCNNFGPNQDAEKFIPKIFKSISEGEEVPIYGNGLQSREWIHVDDNVQIILKLMITGARGTTYNIGSGIHYKNIEIVNYIGKILGKEVLRKEVADRLGHDKAYRVDANKVKHFLGDRTYQPLERYLKDVANEYKRV